MPTIDGRITDGVKIFRNVAKAELDMYSDMEINRKWDTPMPGLLWMFCTDNKKINAWVFNPEGVDKAFKQVMEIYNGKKLLGGTERLQKLYGISNRKIDKDEITENFKLAVATYLLFHEVGHPMDVPVSKEDEKLIDKALYEAIREVCPNESRAVTAMKVSGCRNMVYDVGVDSTFFKRWKYDRFGSTLRGEVEDFGEKLDGFKVKDLPDGTIPVWDVIELNRNDKHDAQASWAMSRAMYAMMFADDAELRGDLFTMFHDALLRSPEARAKRIDKDNVAKRIKSSYMNMVSLQKKDVLADLDIEAKEYGEAVDSIYDEMGGPKYVKKKDHVVKCMTALLSDERSRYNVMKGFIKPFADLLSAENSSARGEGQISAGTATSVLQNLLDELGEGEAQQLLQDVMNNMGRQNPYQGRGHGCGSEKGDPKQGLDKIAMDEYYKRNRHEIKVKNPSYEDTIVDMGMEQEWKPKSSDRITHEDLMRLDQSAIRDHQDAVGPSNPVLVYDGEIEVNGVRTTQYILNEYEVEENQLKTTRSVSTGLEVPENVVFIIDSSSSMGSGTGNYAGSNEPYDELQKVLYGVWEALAQAAEKTHRKSNIGVCNFSSMTRWSGFADLQESYKTADNPIKEMLHTPENGGTFLDAALFDRTEREKKKGKTAYVIITDGALGGGEAVLQAMKQYSNKKENAFVYVEIGSESDFGKQVKAFSNRNNNVQHYAGSISEIGKKLENVLIKYG